MKKGVRLRVTLYVRGEDEPAADFATRAKRAVREVMAAGRSERPDVSIVIRRIEEDDADEDSTTTGED